MHSAIVHCPCGFSSSVRPSIQHLHCTPGECFPESRE
jgi:hypothetical protein